MRPTAALLLSLAITASPITAQANISAGVRAGSLGLGLEVAKLMTPNLAIRGGAYRFSHSFSRTESDVQFDADLDFKALSGIVDFFPAARGSFHLSGGLISTPAKVDATGKPTGDSFTFNDVDYPTAQVGTVTGTARWPKTLPYVGIGWGTPASSGGGLSFLFDLGVGIGKPTIGLSASAAAAGSALAADVEAERVKIEDNVNKYLKVYPVISLGLAIRF